MKRRSILLVLAGMTVALASSIPALATFSGKNGRIAFQAGSVAGTDIYTMNPDGSDVRQLTFFVASGGSAQGPFWSPDGRQIVFVGAASAANGPYQLWIMNSDGSNQNLLLNDPANGDWVPSFSPDGRYIIFSRCGPINCAIYRINADGSGLRALTPFNSDHDIGDWGPVYSPDGRTIAFTSWWRDGLLEAVYLMNADGSGLRSFTPPRLGALGADWSPDGENIVFYSNDPFDCGLECFVLSSELWSISTDDGETTRLTFTNRYWNGINSVPHDLWPSWSPQGDAIVFERDAPDFSSSALYIMDSDSGNARPVLQLPARRVDQSPRRTFIRGPKRAKPEMLKAIEQGGSFPRWGSAPHDAPPSRAQ
jgi:Tol biopolymer transport system component